MDDLHDSDSSSVWAIFSDLMAALVGILVLVLVWVIGIQLELSQSLEEEKARRVAEEQRRKQARVMTLDEVEDLYLMADERADPAREALGEQEIAMLRRALSELPRRRRAIVTAARLNDVPHKEIAARHGVSLRTVEKELKAGLEHCCKRLDREYIQRFGPKIKRPPS